MKKALLIAVSSVAMLSACSLAPDYERPAAPVAAAWPEGEAYQASSARQAGNQESVQSLADVEWKSYFRSPRLQSLIQLALDNNRDLRVAALNVEVARATYRVRDADMFPTVNAGGDYSLSRTPRSVSSTGADITSRQYSASLGVTAFELDLFGRLRSLEQTAVEQFLASQEGRTSAQISLVSEVANAWLTLLADRKLLTLTNETLSAQQQSYRLIEQSFNSGIGSQLDVSQARTSVETARANKALYQRQLAQDLNALTLLVGAPVTQDMVNGEELDSVDFVSDLPAGLPSDVLLRRPDILRAEHLLKGANANIGAARAAFFPTLSLTGSFGVASKSLGNLFDGGTGAWSVAPGLTLPIFDMGRNAANLDSAKASRDIAVAQYEKAIQTAFREVSDALAAQGTYGEQLDALKGLVDANQQSYDLSRARYQRGIDNYLNVLDAQRSLYNAQQQQISIELGRLTNKVTLYKVLGGGVK